MLRQFFLLIIVVCLSVPLSAQTKPVKPLNKKPAVLKIERDIKHLQAKVKGTFSMDQKSKEKLASDYSDWVDQIDQNFHGTKPKTKSVQSAALVKVNKKDLDL